MILLKGNALRLRILDNILAIVRDNVYPVVNPVHHGEVERHFQRLRDTPDLASSVRLETHDWETLIVIRIDTRPKEGMKGELQ